MNDITKDVAGIAALVIGVAILSVLVSTKSNTTGVIQAAASGFGNILSVATSPVTGGGSAPNLSYPSAAGLGGLSDIGIGNFNINGLG